MRCERRTGAATRCCPLGVVMTEPLTQEGLATFREVAREHVGDDKVPGLVGVFSDLRGGSVPGRATLRTASTTSVFLLFRSGLALPTLEPRGARWNEWWLGAERSLHSRAPATSEPDVGYVRNNMAETTAHLIIGRIARAHGQVLQLSEALREPAWQAGPRAPAIHIRRRCAAASL